MANYTVFDQGKTINGDARTLLEQIRVENSRDNAEIRGMDVDAYAQALIEDAEYFLPYDLLAAMKDYKFDTDYDRALAYLSQMPTSGVKILAAR